MINEITTDNKKLEKCRLFYPMERDNVEMFFSLVDYRNNYFTSEDPNKIIEFYNGFENRDQLIQWMRERPKGVANVHEVEGDKDIIVVIPTADFNGKYARECRENIFKGLHMVFVESGGKGDFYFNYAHNCNVGIRKAMEYNPKWVVVSNDDMEKIDNLNKMTKLLDDLPYFEPYLLYSESRAHTINVVNLGFSTVIRKYLYYLVTSYTRHIIYFEKKYGIRYHVTLTRFPYNLFLMLS